MAHGDSAWLMVTHHDQLWMIVTDGDSSWLIESYDDSYRPIVTHGDYKSWEMKADDPHPNPSLTLTLVSP